MLTDRGIGIGLLTAFGDVTVVVSSSEDEPLSSCMADGPLLATLMYVQNGGVPLPAKDLAELWRQAPRVHSSFNFG